MSGTAQPGPLASVRALWRRAGAPRPVVGATPHDVVLAANKWRLLHFRSSTPRRYRTPIVMVPSLINRWYVLDLAPGRSLCEWLVAQGFDVYVIDWGTPGPEDRYVSLADVTVGILGQVVRHVAARHQNDVHLLGYCLGGTLATAFTAATSSAPTNDSTIKSQVASLTLLAAPIDFSHAGILGAWSRDERFDVRGLVNAFGNMPWQLMQAAFQLIRPTGQLHKLVNVLDRAWDDEYLDGFIATEIWGNDNVAFPGQCYAEYIEWLYRENRLVQGTLVLHERPARLAAITAPVHVIAFNNDAIVPAQCALAITDAVGGCDTQALLLPGGHVGAVVSRKAKDSLWPQLAAFWAQRDMTNAAAKAPKKSPLSRSSLQYVPVR